MRLSISNIAWDTSEDEEIAKLLKHYDVDAIDIAPGKYFPDPAKAIDEEIARVKQWWAARGIEITGMQSLLFGTTGLNVFGSSEVQDTLFQHLAAVCRIGAGLGATRLVFGSPKNRDRSGLSDEQVMSMAIPFFRRLGEIAQSNGVVICLEPNPPCYGANFMTTCAETAEVVRQVAHPAIRMQLDTGALTLNDESVAEVLATDAELVAHIHASEPQLKVLGDCGTNHGPASLAIRRFCPNRIVTIEMREDEEAPLASLERALSFAKRWYGEPEGT